MKRFLVGCAVAMAILAASEQRASANGSWGFNIGVDVGFKFGWWSSCNNCCPNYPCYNGYPNYPAYYGNAATGHSEGYANAPAAPVPAAPAAAPARPAVAGAQQIGYSYYPSTYGYYGYGYNYGYTPSYWYGY